MAKSDIAFRYDLDRLNAIWLMNGLNLGSVGSYTNGSYHWRLTGAGDFGSGSNPTNGVKDGKDDLLFTHYDPASNTIGMSQAGIWFMDGTTLTHASTVMNSSGQVMGLNPPDFRAVAAANFDNGDGGNKTDLLIRHAVIGRQGVWRMSGYIFQAGAWIKPQPDPAWKLFSQDWLQSTWRHNEPYPKGFYPFVSAHASSLSPVKFTLNFRIPPNPFGTYGLTIRRRVGEGAWTTLASNHMSDSYTDQDSSLTTGVRYEYEVWRQGSQAGWPFWYPARVFTSANQPIELMENRGKVLVIVESNVVSGISTGLKTFTNNLIGDGWTVVLKADAPRHDNRIVACGNSYQSDPAADTANLNGRNTVKAFIDQHSDAKGIVVVGHVTVPLAGALLPADGHTNHRGAWVADAWYGHSGSGWTDTQNIVDCVPFPWNRNMSGDGKFTESQIPVPSGFTKFVGRIDFARLPVTGFGTGDAATHAEKNLLNAYFAKNHGYRTKAVTYENRAAVFQTFEPETPTTPVMVEPFYFPIEHACRNMSPLFGSGFDKIVAGDPFHQKSDSYLWGFLGGYGGPDLISENAFVDWNFLAVEGNFMQHSTQQLTGGSESKIAFYLLMGSYFGDWLFQNDFLRATIATPNHGLAAVWLGKDFTYWQLHGLGVGEPLGQGLVHSIRHGNYDEDQAYDDGETWMSIIGDPTLRMTITAPPINLQYNAGTLSWQAGESNCQGCEYYIYHAGSMAGSFQRIAGPLTSTVLNSAPASGVLMVRKARPVTTGSATFINLSQGAFYDH